MSRHIILSPDAAADLDVAVQWYRRTEIALSRCFRAEVRLTVLRIARHPYASVRVNDRVRRVLTNRFPYRIDFTFDANIVLVLAITHQRRADAGWKNGIVKSPEMSDE